MSNLTFESTNGATFSFDGTDGYQQADLLTGLVTTPNELVIDPKVGGDGGVLVTRRKGVKRLLLTVLVNGTPTEQMQRWAALCAALDAGGDVVFDGPNGPRRLTEVILEDPSRNEDGFDDNYFTCSLLALDPWWLAAGTASVLNLGASTPFDASIAFDASLPFDGGTTTVVANGGDAVAFPIVEVTGPATTLQISAGAGQGWELAAPLAAGQILVVRHTEGGTYYPSTAGQLGPYLLGGPGVDWSWLSPSWDLFGLARGSTTVGVSATGTDGDTQVRLLFNERFLTP